MVISTPDHWHVPISLLALEAGKDVFSEKPTLTIAEGRKLAETVKHHKAVFQTGIEDRSVIYYYRMAELVRNGAIGQLKTIRVKLPAGTAYPLEKPAPVPADLNWDLWLGPAPFHPFTPTRTEAMHWRQVRDYSGGLLTDWGSHLMDTAQVANFAEQSGPVEVEGTGEIPKLDGHDVRHVQAALPLCQRRGDVRRVGRRGHPLRRQRGLDRQRRLARPAGRDLHRVAAAEVSPRGQQDLADAAERAAQFPQLRQIRQPTTYTAEADQRLSTAMHIGNIAMEIGRKLKWDPKSESFPDDEAANALRSRPARDDWMKK